MGEINMGTLYDMNKNAVAAEKPLTNIELKNAIKRVRDFFLRSTDKYFMLLNKVKL